jgi:hypothetical protein
LLFQLSFLLFCCFFVGFKMFDSNIYVKEKSIQNIIF